MRETNSKSLVDEVMGQIDAILECASGYPNSRIVRPVPWWGDTNVAATRERIRSRLAAVESALNDLYDEKELCARFPLKCVFSPEVEEAIGRTNQRIKFGLITPDGGVASDFRKIIGELEKSRCPTESAVFTPEDIKALRKCADNAERWACKRMYDPEDHDCYEVVRSISDRIAALLPPEKES